MDVLTRNYYRMIRNGAFGENEPLEAMSEYKWRKIKQMAEADNVVAYMRSDDAHPLPSPPEKAEPTDYSMPSSRRLRHIADKERHAMDTSVASLHLLSIMVHNDEQTLIHRTSLRMIIEMGMFLRHEGDKVDFLKIERWLRKLGIRRLTELHCSVLTALLGFNINELPFMRRSSPMAQRLILRDRKLTVAYLLRYPGTTISSWLRHLYNTVTQIEE